MSVHRRLLVVGLAAIPVITATGCGHFWRTTLEENFFCALLGGQPSVAYDFDGDPMPVCILPGRAKSAVAAPGELLYIVAAAHVSGTLGTDWRSDLELHNPGDETATVTVWRLAHGADNSSPTGVPATVAPGASLRLGDVLGGGTGLAGQAALAVSVSAGRVIATSRTYNLLAAGNPLGLPGGATFGQFIPSLPRRAAIAFGEQGRLIQLSHSTATDGGFRTNLGLVNATAVPIHVDVELHVAGGARLGTVPVDLPPYGCRQLNRVYAAVTAGDVDDGYAVVRTTTEGGRFYAYASVVDNLTGDPIAITADPLPSEEPPTAGEPVYVVAGAHVAGLGGATWRSDVEVHCWGDVPAAFTVELLEHGVDNTTPAHRRSYTLGAGTSVRFADILDREFGVSGQAALRVTPTAGHVVVTSRTYNLLGEGNSAGLPPGSTFGQFIPGMSLEQAIREGEEGRLIQLSHTPGGARGFRTNLVLVNASARRIEVEVDLFRSDGTPLGTASRSLAPYEYRQLNGVFEAVTGAVIEDGYGVVRTTTPGGAVFALASVVDNLTGDPVGQPATVVLSEAAAGVLDGLGGISELLGRTTIEGTVDGIRAIGMDGVLDVFVSAWPGIAGRTSGGVLVDYGDGTPMPGGGLWTGATTVDASGITVTRDRVFGVATVTHDDLRVDGEPAAVGSTAWRVDLEERPDGTVAGAIDVEPRGANAADGALGGRIVVDTAICERYPISGSLTLVHRGEVITIAPSPECDGGLERDLVVAPLGVDFAATAGNPEDPRAGAFIVGTDNAVVAREGETGRYWRPIVGGATLDTTTPGVVTFHFGFDRPVVGGRLLLTLATFHWSYSRGHAFLFGSTDGVDWRQLAEVEPPELGAGRGGGWNGALPPLFVGATDIWLQARLYSFGPSAPIGGVYCNTAQLLRFDTRQTSNTFELEVELAPR